MPIRIPKYLDLYLTMDQRQMQPINVDYNVKVGYWASRNNVDDTKSMPM
jgi:hypothetical protein